MNNEPDYFKGNCHGIIKELTQNPLDAKAGNGPARVKFQFGKEIDTSSVPVLPIWFSDANAWVSQVRDMLASGEYSTSDEAAFEKFLSDFDAVVQDGVIYADIASDFGTSGLSNPDMPGQLTRSGWHAFNHSSGLSVKGKNSRGSHGRGGRTALNSLSNIGHLVRTVDGSGKQAWDFKAFLPITLPNGSGGYMSKVFSISGPNEVPPSDIEQLDGLFGGPRTEPGTDIAAISMRRKHPAPSDFDIENGFYSALLEDYFPAIAAGDLVGELEFADGTIRIVSQGTLDESLSRYNELKVEKPPRTVDALAVKKALLEGKRHSFSTSNGSSVEVSILPSSDSRTGKNNRIHAYRNGMRCGNMSSLPFVSSNDATIVLQVVDVSSKDEASFRENEDLSHNSILTRKGTWREIKNRLKGLLEEEYPQQEEESFSPQILSLVAPASKAGSGSAPAGNSAIDASVELVDVKRRSLRKPQPRTNVHEEERDYGAGGTSRIKPRARHKTPKSDSSDTPNTPGSSNPNNASKTNVTGNESLRKRSHGGTKVIKAEQFGRFGNNLFVYKSGLSGLLSISICRSFSDRTRTSRESYERVLAENPAAGVDISSVEVTCGNRKIASDVVDNRTICFNVTEGSEYDIEVLFGEKAAPESVDIFAWMKEA